MKFKKILYFIFLINFYGYAQNDSIKLHNYEKLLLTTSNDTSKINLLKKINAIYVKDSNFNKAIEYEIEISKIANKNKYNEDYIESLINLSHYYKIIGNFEKGLFFAKKSISESKKFNNYHIGYAYKREASLYFSLKKYDSLKISCENILRYNKNKEHYLTAYNYLAGIHHANNNYEKAVENLIRGREISEEMNDFSGVTTVLVNLSLIYIEMNKYPEALINLNKCMKISEEYNFPESLAYCNILMGEIFMEQELYDDAIKKFRISSDLLRNSGRHGVYADLINSYGIAYLLKKEYDSAITKFNDVINLEKKMEYTYKTPYTYINLAQTYFELGQLDTSLKYIDSINQIPEIHVDVEIKYYELLSKLNVYEKDHKSAYENHLKYTEIKDSIDLESKKKEAYVLEANYQFKKKEKEIEILNTKNKIKNQQLYLLIGFVTMVLLVLLIIYSRYKTNKKTKEKFQELDKIKTRFFTNISHEFRTPLSLIIGYFQNEIDDAKNKKEESKLIIPHRNAERLHSLVNQLLDLSKIESGSMPLAVSEVDLDEFLRIIFSFFSSKAQEKNIKYICSIDPKIKNGYLDKDKIEKVLINLLSNAFKFTNPDGNIHFNATLNNNRLSISISDTGIGISSNKINKVFNRFYQVDDSSTRLFEGSGIGLALSKELAEVHKGSLRVNSIIHKGSEFILEIPINKSSYTNKEVSIIDFNNNLFIKDTIEFDGGINNTNDKPLVLIVEDNIDMQSFISDILKSKYNTISASNGKDGFIIAKNELPDIIISDYMMPEINGIELCKMIKNDELTSHIPIMILTAKAEQENKLKGLGYGADSYLTKPFNKKEFELIIRNLLKQNEKVKALLNKSVLSVKELSLPASEVSFFEKLMMHFEENYSKASFGIDQLAENLYLSRSQLYRKVKNVTDKTPSDLLRNFRMEKAKKMLLQSSKNVGQVAVEVGFCNQSNFSRNFKVFTGLSPIDYVNKFTK